MGTKLYVANLPSAPSALALRAHFSSCGAVVDVEIIPDRNGGRGRGSAIIRMGNAAAAERAISELNRSSFAGQLLLVEAAPDGPGERRSPTQNAEKQTEGEPGARITLQFREPQNMAYELDCAGVALVLRIFFQTPEGAWRIVAQARGATDAPGAESTAASRAEALRNIARTCREGGDVAALAHIDWDAVEQALSKVRAL